MIPGQRPPPPADLSADEQALWEQVVGALPQGWIGPEAYAVLVQYVRHCCYADDVAAQIAELRTQTDPKQRRLLLALYRAHGQQTARMSALAVKLRLTPSSRSTADRARDDRKDASSSPVVKPWLDWPGAKQ
jgi:hypothetical protein